MGTQAPDPPSLIRGGPWAAFEEATGLIRKDGRPAVVRVAILALLLWLPLALLAYAQGGASAALLVLQDYVVGVRLLVAVPLLLVSEVMVDRRVSLALDAMHREGLIPPEKVPFWEEGLRRAHKFATGTLPFLALVGISLVLIITRLRSPLQETSVDWMRTASGTASWAGMWYTILGRPFCAFLVLLWVWRWITIAWLLRRTSKVPLKLMVSHPDRVGGLGVLGEGPYSASMVIFALGSVVSAHLAWEMTTQGATLKSLAPAIGVFAVGSLLMAVGPLIFLTPQLFRLQRHALVEYGVLAARHSHSFERRWVEGKEGKDENIVGAPDFSSLIDLGSSYDVARSIRALPFRVSMLRSTLLAALIPMAPLLLIEAPLEELLVKLAKMLL
jgi:hypothetical protein